MTQLDPNTLFDAIRNRDRLAVKAYLVAGGSLSVRSDEGRTPLAEVAYLLVSDKDRSSDDFFTYGPAAPAATEVTPVQKDLHEIGCLLLENGANYKERAARTNRSILISQLIFSHFPVIHKEWDAIHQKNIMMGFIRAENQGKLEGPKKQRKM